MRFLPLLLCFVCLTAFAEINEKYSYQAYPYHGLSFKDRPAAEFNNTTIIGSCFYQEWVEGDAEVVKDIFPDGITGVTFENCNLDNVFIPAGNTVKGGTNNKIKVQNDWADWKLNDSLEPVEPVNKDYWIKAGVSIDPADIPEEKLTEEEREAFEENFAGVIP